MNPCFESPVLSLVEYQLATSTPDVPGTQVALGADTFNSVGRQATGYEDINTAVKDDFYVRFGVGVKANSAAVGTAEAGLRLHVRY